MKRNKIEFVKYFLERDIYCDEDYLDPASCQVLREFERVNYALKPRHFRKTFQESSEINEDTMTEWSYYLAVKYENLDLIRYFHESHCPRHEALTRVAVLTENLEIPKFFCQRNCSTAVLTGNRQIIDYLTKTKCSFDGYYDV